MPACAAEIDTQPLEFQAIRRSRQERRKAG